MSESTPARDEGENANLDGESGVGAGSGDVTSTEKPAEVLPDDAPDHRSGLETGDDEAGEKFSDTPE